MGSKAKTRRNVIDTIDTTKMIPLNEVPSEGFEDCLSLRSLAIQAKEFLQRQDLVRSDTKRLPWGWVAWYIRCFLL